jgi:hypothetical protein
MIARVHASVLVHHGADETCQVSPCGLTRTSTTRGANLGLPGLIVNLQYSATEGDMNIALHNLRDWCSFERAILYTIQQAPCLTAMRAGGWISLQRGLCLK